MRVVFVGWLAHLYDCDQKSMSLHNIWHSWSESIKQETIDFSVLGVKVQSQNRK